MSNEALELKWELVVGTMQEQIKVRRAKVPGGWLVVLNNSVTYMPDPAGTWAVRTQPPTIVK